MAIEEFRLPFSQEAVDDLRSRLSRTRWPDQISASGWEYGVNLDFLRELCEYWRDGFDWKTQVERLSEFRHFRYEGIHFIHERSQARNAIPLILTHGWPGSFVEMLKIIPLLTDSFDVVVPSMPGFGFSDRPAAGMNTFGIAATWAALMKELGYERFGAQGGDIGAGVSTILGLRHSERILGVHLNYIPGSFRPHLDAGAILDADEEAFLRDAGRWAEENGAYSHIQRTRPLTAAVGLNDSPAGLAAWIVEKFREWSDCDGEVYRRFTRDELLTNITLYWMTETIHSSFRVYYEGRKAPLHFGEGEFVHVPCAVAHFPKEAPFPPRVWVERGYNIQRWTEMPIGGHFAAWEVPELLAADIRAFFHGL